MSAAVPPDAAPEPGPEPEPWDPAWQRGTGAFSPPPSPGSEENDVPLSSTEAQELDDVRELHFSSDDGSGSDAEADPGELVTDDHAASPARSRHFSLDLKINVPAFEQGYKCPLALLEQQCRDPAFYARNAELVDVFAEVKTCVRFACGETEVCNSVSVGLQPWRVVRLRCTGAARKAGRRGVSESRA